VDGELQCEATDSSHTTGKIGLYNYYCESEFDDVKVRN
jgi:hypothetical protein